ncbi:MAG: hypothetical protein WCK39_03115 [Methanomassiliicoccales archaeon]
MEEPTAKYPGVITPYFPLLIKVEDQKSLKTMKKAYEDYKALNRVVEIDNEMDGSFDDEANTAINAMAEKKYFLAKAMVQSMGLKCPNPSCKGVVLGLMDIYDLKCGFCRCGMHYELPKAVA